MKLAIFGRVFDKEVAPHVVALFDTFREKKIEFTIFEPFLQFLTKAQHIDYPCSTFQDCSEIKSVDFGLSIGGDGTLLEAITVIGDTPIPLLALNAGRLGFLANTPAEQMTQALNDLLEGNFTYDERILVKAETDPEVFGELNFGLNEFAIQKRDTASMLVIHTYIDGEFLNSYWSDGIIVATPTGSTGYSLSVGGPLVMPQTNNFVISPVNPHNLNVRPMVVPDDSEISFKVEGRAKKILVSLDSRSKSVISSVDVRITRQEHKVRLVKLEGTNYFNTLRNKLNWGLDARN